jgi:hypothetical protein
MPWPTADEPQFCAFPWDESKPALALTECGEVFESCSTDGPTPDFSCVDDPGGNPPAEPSTVTLTGFVDVFSSGPNADGARIQVFRQSQLAGATDIDAVTPLASADVVLDTTTLVVARACPKEKDFMQGQCVVPTADCGGGCNKTLDAVSFCWETSCEDLQRWEVRYAIANIPTNEFLIIRTVGLDDGGAPQVLNNTWSPLVQYNVFLRTDDRACTNAEDNECLDATGTPALYQANVNLLSSQDYLTIPTSAGLSAGITPGHGAIAGEVHDCNRLRVRHAQIGFSIAPRVLVYFNGNPVKTLPRLQQIQEGTDPLSLYSGLDIPAEPVAVVAIGVADGALREIGRFSARVWPDSVTIIGLGGGRPPQ